MKIAKNPTFDNISQRVLWSFNFMFSDFAPISSNIASESAQKDLHTLFANIIDTLYQDPTLLELPTTPDQAFDWHVCNNQIPELNDIFMEIYDKLYTFYKFLLIAGLAGKADGSTLTIDKPKLKEHKAAYKKPFAAFFQKLGITCTAIKNDITLQFQSAELLNALHLLSQTDDLFAFACCSFNGSYDHLLQRIDDLYDYNGFLLETAQTYLRKGFAQSISIYFGKTGLGLDIKFTIGSKDTGFKIVFNGRKKDLFRFGTMSGVGEKAMLEDFASLDPLLQKHFIKICRPCNSCLACTKGGKSKQFTANANYNGSQYQLCPQFPQHEWERLDQELADTLFTYLETQQKYA